MLTIGLVVVARSCGLDRCGIANRLTLQPFPRPLIPLLAYGYRSWRYLAISLSSADSELKSVVWASLAKKASIVSR